MNARLAETWYAAFMQVLQRHEAARPLREAAAAGRLGAWTEALTGVVVEVCREMGRQTAARWHRLDVLPISRSEYLALDAMAFTPSSAGWPFPVAVFELENSRQDDKVAYSLWKLLCVRAQIRILFCYRRDVAAGGALVRQLEETVVGSLPIEERVNLVGETLLIVGSRAEQATFPYGFFKDWILDKNVGHFARN